MRETPLSLCEKEFLLKTLKQSKRIDGRGIHDYRQIQISFGLEWGSCLVSLGNTRILAQVSVEISQPKLSRPSEGLLHLNVELSPMAASHFANLNRQSMQYVQLSSSLKHCIVDSRVLDLESLCIIAGSKVWLVRVTVNILNHDGNLLDCASIAAICALLHYRRPDVSVSGEEIKIHSADERDPLPLSIHHIPICVTFACFEEGKYILLDPDGKEERIMEGKILIAVNKHREICMLQAMGSIQLTKEQVLRFTNIAVARVTDITEKVQSALESDNNLRKSGGKPKLIFGEVRNIQVHVADSGDSLTASSQVPSNMTPATVVSLSESSCDEIMDDTDISENNDIVYSKEELHISTSSHIKDGEKMSIGEGGPNTWDIQSVDNPSSTEATVGKNANVLVTKQTVSYDHASESEEEETISLQQESLKMDVEWKRKNVSLNECSTRQKPEKLKKKL